MSTLKKFEANSWSYSRLLDLIAEQSEIEVTFKKKDGSVRTMWVGAPPADVAGKFHTEAELDLDVSYGTFWSIDDAAWRAIIFDNIVTVRG